MDTRKLLIGAAAGFIATAPMTLFMISAYRRLPKKEQYPLPPRQVTMGVLDAVHAAGGIEEPAEKSAATMTAHFLYGAAAGSLYGPMSGKSGIPAAVEGAVLGAALWTASYGVWVPAAGLMPPPTRTPIRRNVLMFAANILWGAITAVLTEQGKRAWLGEESALEALQRRFRWR